jgi:hypothetical protein
MNQSKKKDLINEDLIKKDLIKKDLIKKEKHYQRRSEKINKSKI